MPIQSNEGFRRIALSAAAVLAALAAATALVAALETAFRLDNASAVYLLAVVAIAILLGTAPAIATAIGAFLAYNFAFVEPRYTFTVGRADEVLTLFLLLFVGIVSGRLAGRQRDREQKASRREREARAIFGISRELATSERLTDAMQSVVARLADETGMERTWVGLGATVMHERVVADSGGVATPRPTVGTHSVLQRDREEGAATWTRIRAPAAAGMRHAEPHGTTRRTALFRVELRSAEETVGSLWSQRADSAGQPQLEETRLLAAAADQLGQAVRRERLQAQTAELEIARRSDELKSALVDSVSHDLRTPLATIRATAGSLADPAIELSDEDRRAAAAAIDAEAHRLNRLVGDLLDMSRIQGGALVADIEVIPLDELVRPAVERARAEQMAVRSTWTSRRTCRASGPMRHSSTRSSRTFSRMPCATRVPRPPSACMELPTPTPRCRSWSRTPVPGCSMRTFRGSSTASTASHRRPTDGGVGSGSACRS